LGIDVGPDLRVVFSKEHEKRVVTDPNRNPVLQQVGDFPVLSIFRRVKTGDKDRDGNPLIYALKRKRGYRIGFRSASELWRAAHAILPQIVAAVECDMIVPLPSSSNIAGYVARAIQRAYGANAPEIRALFEKATVGEALRRMVPPDQVEPKLRREYGSYLHTLHRLPTGAHVQMKEVSPQIRHLVPSVTPIASLHGLDGCRVMLVDDLLSTGSTFMSARACLDQANVRMVFGVCLLSGLGSVRTDIRSHLQTLQDETQPGTAG